MTTRPTRFATRLWPFLPTAGTVWVVWTIFRGRALVADGTWIDHAIVLGIGGAYLFAVAIMLAATARWTWRGLGQVCTYLGDVVLYAGSGAARLGWRHQLTVADVNLALACLATGAALLVVGLLWWIKGEADERVDDRVAAKAARHELAGWIAPETNGESR